MKQAFVLIIVMLTSTVAWSQDADPCGAARNTIEINECAKRMLAQRDKELNAAYRNLVKALAPSDSSDATNYDEVRKNLLNGQRHWMRFRDDDCRAKYLLNAGGTIRDAVHLGCLIEHTEQRTRQLLDWNAG